MNLKLWDRSSGGLVGEEEDSDLRMASLTVSAHQDIQMNRPSSFSIDSILGLNRPDQRTALSAPYRPWTGERTHLTCTNVFSV